MLLVSGKMLRHNEERNLMAFKYNNRSIRIYPVFVKKYKYPGTNAKKVDDVKNRSFLSKESENYSERDSEDSQTNNDGN